MSCTRRATSREVATELWRMAKEYQAQAAKLGAFPEIGDEPVFRSVVDLQFAINRFVVETNADPKPFVRTADPKRVLAAVKRALSASGTQTGVNSPAR